jgi:amino acid transporter
LSIGRLAETIYEEFGCQDLLELGNLVQDSAEIFEAKFELTKLNVQDKIEGIAVKAAYALITFILGIVVVIFLSILISLGINHLLENNWLGFLIMFIFYAIIFVVFIFAKASVLSTIKKRVEEVVDENL